MMKNTARKSCFARKEHIDGLPGTQLLEKDEMYEGAYWNQRSPPQAYYHQANQFQQYHEYSQPQRNFPPADYRNYKFNENKENKNGPEGLAYYLQDRREPGYSSYRSSGERRQSSSPRNKSPYYKRRREEYGRKRSSYRSPRDYSFESSRSSHSRSPKHRSSNSPRGNASRSSSRYHSSKYSSNRSWKRSREREKMQRSRSSSKSESASEASEGAVSHEKGIKRPVSSVCKIVNEKKRSPYSKHNQFIKKKLKKEQPIGLEMTLGSMSPISSEDFSQRSGEAESDGEFEDCEKKAQQESNNGSISIKTKENGCSVASNSISSQNQEQIMQKEHIEESQAREQNNVNILKSQRIVEKKAAATDRKVRESSGDKNKHEKGYVNKNDISESNSKPKDSENEHKGENLDKMKRKSEKVSLNVEDNCTESNATAQKPSEDIKNHKMETLGKNEEDLNKKTLNIEKLEQTLIESNTKLNSKIMPREMVSKIISLVESRGKNSEIPAESNKIENEQTDSQKDKTEKVGFREKTIKNRINILPEDESKQEDEKIPAVTNLSESYTNDEKCHKSNSSGSSEELNKKVEDRKKEKLITKNQKGYLNSIESIVTRKDICEDQKKKKNNEKFPKEQVQIKSFLVENLSEIFPVENCFESTDKANENKKKSGTTDEKNKKSTDTHKDVQNNCTNGQDLKCSSSLDYVDKNIHEGTIEIQSQSSVNCKQGQKSNIILQGSSRNQEKICSKNTKDKLNQTPTNLDQSHSHTLSLKDKRRCFEDCIKARQKNDSHSQCDSRKNEQSSKISHTNPEEYKKNQEKKPVQDNINKNKDQQKSKKLEAVPAKTKERRHSGAAHELLNTRVRKLSGPANLPQYVRERKHSGTVDESQNAVEGQSCDETSPAVVKGTMNRPTGNVFYPLGRVSEKKRKLSPPNKTAESANDVTLDLGGSKKSKLSIPVIQEQRATAIEIENKLEESNPNANIKKNDPEESASEPKRSLFGKNKKRISHYTQLDNKEIARGQIQTTVLALSQKTSPSQNTKTNIFKKFTTKKVSGSPVQSKTQNKHKLEKKMSVESNGTEIKQTEEVRLSHSDNIFERIKEGDAKEHKEKKTVSENLKAGVKRTHENFRNMNSDIKKRKHEENNVTSVQEKPLSFLKGKNMTEREMRHISSDTINKSETKTTGDEKSKRADSKKRAEMQKKTSSMAEVNEMFGESGESKGGGSDFCRPVPSPQIPEFETNICENLICIQSKYLKYSKSDESRLEEKRVNFNESNTKSNESSEVVCNEADNKERLKESSKEISHMADDRGKSKELFQEVSHETDSKVKLKESSKMIYIQTDKEKSKEPSKVISVRGSHLEKSKESSKSKEEALCLELIDNQANSKKIPNENVETELPIFNDFKKPETQVEVEKDRDESAKEKIKDFDSKSGSTEEPKVLEKENGLLKSTKESINAFDNISEPANFKTFETEIESETDDDDSDVGDIEPIEMIGSVFLNDACLDEQDENVMGSNVEKTEMEPNVEKTEKVSDNEKIEMDSNVENTETATVQIKYCDDQMIVHNTDDSRKPPKGKGDSLDENDKNQQTNDTETKTKITPRKRFTPQLETLGKMIEEEKGLDDFETEKLETRTQNERKKVIREQLYDIEDDDDSKLISSGVEISPSNEKTSTTLQWLEKAKKKLKVPESLIKAKDCSQTQDNEKVVDIIPDTPEQNITFSKTIFEKGFGVSHTKQLKNGEFVQTIAHFFPKKLYRTSSREEKNLGKCLLCLSCSMYFTPLAFTVHHDTQSVVEQIASETSKQQGYRLVERGDADTMKMFKDFMHYFQAERKKQYSSSPVTLPQTKTPTEEKNCFVSEDKDLRVTLKDIEGATAALSASNVLQIEHSQTKSPETSATGVVSPSVSKESVHMQHHMHPISVHQMKQAHQPSELVPAQVNQIYREQPKQIQLAEKQQNVAQIHQTSCGQRIQQVQNEVGNQLVKTKQPSEQPVKPDVPQAPGDQWQTSQTSQPQNPNNINLMLAGHSKLTADHKQIKTSPTAEQQLTSQVNKAVGQQSGVKQKPLKKGKNPEQRTTLQYILPRGSQNQLEQIPQLAGQHLSLVQCTGPQTSQAQVSQPDPQEYFIPGRKPIQQTKQHQNTSVPINVLSKQSISNNFQRDQLCYYSFPGFQQGASQNVISTKNIGTIPMFNPLTALYMNKPVYSENCVLNRSDYTGIPVGAPSSVIIPNSTQVTLQGPDQSVDTTVLNMNNTVTFENMEMPEVRVPARAGSSAQSVQPALRQNAPPEKEHVSRQMSNEVETVVNAGTVEEKRRNLLQQLLELDNIHTGDSGLDLILFGRKYISRGLASVNQEVLRLYRERTANTAGQSHLPQRNGKPMTVEERAYYIGQLRSQHQ